MSEELVVSNLESYQHELVIQTVPDRNITSIHKGSDHVYMQIHQGYTKVNVKLRTETAIVLMKKIIDDLESLRTQHKHLMDKI